MKKIIIILLTIVVSANSANVQAQSQGTNLKKGLIAHYLFNGDLLDNSRNKNDGLEFGGLNYDEDRFGNKCGALHFNGTDGYVVVPSSRSLKSPTTELTVATWIKLDHQFSDFWWITVCCKSDVKAERDNSPQYRCQTTKRTISVNSPSTKILDGTKKLQHPPINYDTWYHYATVYDGSSVKVYLDGQEFYNAPYFGEFEPNDMALEIGRDVPGALEYLKGSLDDLRIYNRGLNAQEIQTIYQDQSEKTSPKPCGTPPPAANPPLIIVDAPNYPTHTTKQPTETIEATIKYVEDKKDVTFRLNGKESRDFSFDPTSQSFKAKVTLIKGNNIYDIEAVNQAGQDEKSGTIILEKTATPRPPIVTITTPSQNPYVTNQEKETIEATIKNVKNKNDVIFKINGTSSRDFSYNPRTQKFSSTINLIKGSNIIEITGINADGRDKASSILKLEMTVISMKPPIVTVISPDFPKHETNRKKEQIQARIKRVKDKSQITFTVNGVKNNDFDFNPSTLQFSSTVSLIEGGNVYNILAKNIAGEDEQTGFIIRKNQVQTKNPPIITIIKPSVSPSTTTTAQQVIIATIEHIKSKKDITFKVNGTPTNDFDFDPTTLEFTTSVDLEVGGNSFEITAVNKDGEDKETTFISFERPIKKPPVKEVEYIDSITVDSPEITIICYDHKQIDGDIVSLYLDGELVVDYLELQAKGKGDFRKKIRLSPGKHELVPKAWNLGKNPPNTMAIEIQDGVNPSHTIILRSQIGKSQAIKIEF